VAKALCEIVEASNEVAKEIGFETEPESFDGIESQDCSPAKIGGEMMPIEALGFMPTGIVDDKDSPFGFQSRDPSCSIPR
jgi:hypothetical protein